MDKNTEYLTYLKKKLLLVDETLDIHCISSMEELLLCFFTALVSEDEDKRIFMDFEQKSFLLLLKCFGLLDEYENSKNEKLLSCTKQVKSSSPYECNSFKNFSSYKSHLDLYPINLASREYLLTLKEKAAQLKKEDLEYFLQLSKNAKIFSQFDDFDEKYKINPFQKNVLSLQDELSPSLYKQIQVFIKYLLYCPYYKLIPDPDSLFPYFVASPSEQQGGLFLSENLMWQYIHKYSSPNYMYQSFSHILIHYNYLFSTCLKITAILVDSNVEQEILLRNCIKTDRVEENIFSQHIILNFAKTLQVNKQWSGNLLNHEMGDFGLLQTKLLDLMTDLAIQQFNWEKLFPPSVCKHLICQETSVDANYFLSLINTCLRNFLQHFILLAKSVRQDLHLQCIFPIDGTKYFQDCLDLFHTVFLLPPVEQKLRENFYTKFQPLLSTLNDHCLVEELSSL